MAPSAVSELGLEGASLRTTPLQNRLELNEEHKCSLLEEPTRTTFQSVLGDIRYLADSTTLDIAYEAARLASMTHKLTTQHIRLLQNLSRYVKRTFDHGILYFS